MGNGTVKQVLTIAGGIVLAVMVLSLAGRVMR